MRERSWVFVLLTMQVALVPQILGQPWPYTFGTVTGSHTSGASTTFLPSPASGGGTAARVRIGTGGGSFNLENPGISDLGSGSELSGIASTSTSYNKFQIYDCTAGKAFTIRFTVRFGGGSSGAWHFFQGDGATYSNDAAFVGTEVFTGIRWTFGASDAITTEYRTGSTWTAIAGSPFVQNINYTVDIYGNNTSGSIGYTYGTSQSVAPNKFDLWVNSVLVGDDLSKAGLADDANVDSWMFYGGSSAGNVATIYLDDIIYTNEIISEGPLPIQLASFSASVIRDRDVEITWRTVSETNNYGFELQRKRGEPGHWTNLAFIAGQGTTLVSQSYSYIDRAVSFGKYFYRIKQIDLDGKSEIFPPMEVSVGAGPEKFVLTQNYPNPFNPTTVIEFVVPRSSYTSLKVYNLLGQEVATLFDGDAEVNRIYSATLNASKFPSGIYFYRLRSGEKKETKRMILSK